MYKEEVMNLELSKTFTTKQRNNMSTLDNYCIFIASRYLDSLDDHINLLFVSKRLRCNMEKFHYNPISLNHQSLSFFPNIETFHCYNEFDIMIIGQKITQYCVWHPVSYHIAL